MTDLVPLDGRSLLGALTDADVRFIVVGGLAVGAHGHVRGTKDIDIVPATEDANLERLARVLRSLDYRIMGTEEFESEELVRPDFDHLKRGGNWVLATRHGRLDIMQYLDPELDFAALDPGAIEDEVFGHRVRFCGYEDLVAMKQAAGRPQDLADLENLRAVRGES